jgi:hypothetical protein
MRIKSTEHASISNPKKLITSVFQTHLSTDHLKKITTYIKETRQDVIDRISIEGEFG